ncbi:MAG: MBL fold metallo-hydrolase [Candidatus Bilamarchaeaceae archaeon]
MEEKLLALLVVFLLICGCGGEAPLEAGSGGGQAGGTGGGGGHLTISGGTNVTIAGGEKPPAETRPAIEYREDANANLYIYFINVGDGDTQGDAILVKKGDFDMLVDGGPESKKQTVVNFLLEKQVDDLEVVVSTHDDPDHYGGLRYVGEKFRIGDIWRGEEGSAEYDYCINSIRKEGQVRYMGKGDERAYSAMRIVVENPIKGDKRFHDADNDGIVLRLEDRGFCALLTGDIDGSAQTTILMDAEPCEVVQMPWHGMSEGLSHLDFLFDKLKPKAVIISGSANDWTNSRQTLYLKAELRKIPVYANYEGKDAKVVYNGNDFAISIEH